MVQSSNEDVVSKRIYFQLVGWLIALSSLVALLFLGKLEIGYITLAGILIIFLDKTAEIYQYGRWILVGTRTIRGQENIYKEKFKLLSKAWAGSEVIFYSPITAYGAYTVGMKVYDRMVASITECVKKGVSVKILCDVFDKKTFQCLEGLRSTGADIKCRRVREPWHYFLILDQKEGIQPRTATEIVGMNGRTYRPMSSEAERIRGSKLRDLISQFRSDWNTLGIPVDNIYEELKARFGNCSER